MSGIYGFSREAVRVKVKKHEGNLQPEFRKFSVDPQITSFEVLQSILGKAFDIKGEFAISYKLNDVHGNEFYMPLLSDWELDAAFLKAYNLSLGSSSEPCLCLKVDLKPFEECSDDWEVRNNVHVITQIRMGTAQEAKPAPRLHGIINQVGKTLNMMQRAFNFGDDGSTSLQPPRLPLSDSEFRKYLDPVGQITHAKELRSVIYFGGIDSSLRKVVWKHILNVYPDGMSGRERMDYIRRKASEYVALRDTWKAAVARGPVVGELAYTTGMVKKDVLRTDRHHKFYAGSDDNQNIASLFNILTTYALNHPKVSYCQGMSDLASPLLVTMGDEAHAYICFCALMSRLSTNFMLDGIAMTQKFTHLAEGLMYYDSEFYNYLKSHQADDLLFCYRWLLLEMKREFAFEDSLRMLEVLWSSLPADPPEVELKLFDTKFQPPISTPPISPLVKTPRESAYTKVCALRRQSSSISLVNYSAKKISVIKRQNHSLDENVGRLKNIISDNKKKHQSLDDTTIIQKPYKTSTEQVIKSPTLKSPRSPKADQLRARSISPHESKSDSVILNNQINAHKNALKLRSSSLSSSMTNLIKNSKRGGHFKDLKEKITAGKVGIFSSLDRLDMTNSIKEEIETKEQNAKLVRNFNEFMHFATINKNKISDKLIQLGTSTDNPKIYLTKSSFDDSESSSMDHTSTVDKIRQYSSTSNSCDDTFDDCSPDDSQEYFPLTTSVTKELRIEMENLDRQVFGNNIQDCLLESDSSCSEASSKINVTSLSRSSCDGHGTDTAVVNAETPPQLELKLQHSDSKLYNSLTKRISKTDDVFLWENPLHKSSPNISIKNIPTPDEQLDIDYDKEVGEAQTVPDKSPLKLLEKCQNLSINTTTNLPVGVNENTAPKDEPPTALTNSCEEVTEKSSSMLPPPNEFGGGNPFLMFLCITVLLQHRGQIISKAMDYNEMAMHFDKMVRKHNVNKVLNQARQMYAGYIKQHTMAQQKIIS
ncbi:hypothetical protein RI129_004758 [Pyrocoelia pectoralis]|uniref:Rab-GAP TBC domain-containing protein n=1 Tax=Pyrocoelia pectoralis TaxID=417401 RepID=A0AAN7VM51_9COLE